MTSLTETETGMLWLAHVARVLPGVRPLRYVVAEGMMRGRRGSADWYVQAGVDGMPDCQVFADRNVYPSYYVEAEWKARAGRMRVSQLARQAYCGRMSIPYLVLRIAKGESTDDTLRRWTEELAESLMRR